MRLCLVAVLALWALGCHSSGDGGNDLAMSACSGSLSGAVTETILACKITWDEKSGTAEVGNDGDLTVSDPSLIVPGATFGFSFTIDGDARTITLSSASTSSYAAGVDLPGDGGEVDSYVTNWSNVIGGPPNLGSLSANILGFTLDFQNGSETQWIVHGSLTATLLPVKTIHGFGSGTVQMTLQF